MFAILVFRRPKKLIAKVLALPEYQEFTIEADAQELLVNTADGDARRLLNLLEHCYAPPIHVV